MIIIMNNEILKSESIKDLFNNESVKKRFQEILGQKSVGFLVSAMNVITNDKLLAEADRNSILFATATAATLDLPVNQNLGFAYILGYRSKDGVKAQFQMGYKGFIQLALRSGQFKTISATPIYEGQIVSSNPLTGMVFDFESKKSDKVIGYASYFSLINGFEKTLYMPTENLKKHGQTYSQTFKKGYGLWADNFDAMAMKTVIKLLLSKYAPLSVEMQKAVLVDQGIVKDWEGNDVEYVDSDKQKAIEGVKVDKKEKELERLQVFITNAETLDQLDGVGQMVEGFKNEELSKQYADRIKELSKT